ncbi:hypothetical protein [Sessilibacter sp. MAH2]
MNKAVFLKMLDFPEIWSTNHLLSDEYFQAAAKEFIKEYGDIVPDDGKEHWRYGAFLHLIRGDLEADQISMLIHAAIADPDKAMAGCVIAELLSKRSASEADLLLACEAVVKNKEYYKTPEELEDAFRAGTMKA